MDVGRVEPLVGQSVGRSVGRAVYPSFQLVNEKQRGGRKEGRKGLSSEDCLPPVGFSFFAEGSQLGEEMGSWLATAWSRETGLIRERERRGTSKWWLQKKQKQGTDPRFLSLAVFAGNTKNQVKPRNREPTLMNIPSQPRETLAEITLA